MPNPPSPDPVRRNARVGPLKLPAEGRKKPAPQWPLASQSVGEEGAWEQLWATPQAVAWERLGWTRTIARYCRIMVAAEHPDAPPAVMAQATALEDRLGLTPKSMRLLLWEIVKDDVTEQRQQTSGARGRIKAV